jgi:hypothetical protein
LLQAAAPSVFGTFAGKQDIQLHNLDHGQPTYFE